MFDGQNNNEWDLQMRSILESGQEEVPAHIWDGVSSGLDALARRRKAVVFFRRAAIGLSAAAALAFGLFLNHSSEDVNVGAVAEIINPVDEAAVSVVDQEAGTEALTAMAPEPVIKPKFRGILPSASKATTEVPSTTDNTASLSTQDHTARSNSQETDATAVEKTGTEKKESADTDNWIEEDKEIKSRKNSASLVLSGVAGTNSAQNRTATAAIRRPTLSAAPAKTAVTQTEPGDIYSIPLSFGVGTKIDFNSKWSLGVGVNYTLLNRKFFGDYTRVEEDRIVESIKSDIRNTQHYIGIPINAYYNIVENRFVNFYAYAGGTVEKCVSDEYRVISKDILHKESVKGVQASANLGIGVEFMLGKHIGLFVDPSARYYFNCNQPKSIRTAQPLMLGFEMGLRVRL
jgi:hypothetical protein